jgi:hypothetical protein
LAHPSVSDQLGDGLGGCGASRLWDAVMTAPAPPMVDNTGESDFDFFTKRPLARHRIRAPFPDEFPPEFLTHGARH